MCNSSGLKIAVNEALCGSFQKRVRFLKIFKIGSKHTGFAETFFGGWEEIVTETLDKLLWGYWVIACSFKLFVIVLIHS